MDRRIPCIPRLPWDAFFMLHAHLAATRSTCDRGPELWFDPGRRGVGAVFVRRNRLVASGYNGSPPGEAHCSDVGHLMIDGHCHRTLHAEENALIQCALDGVSTLGATVYTTASPCWDCAKRLIRAGVRRVCFGARYQSRHDLSETAFGLLTRAGVAHEWIDVSKFIEEVEEESD